MPKLVIAAEGQQESVTLEGAIVTLGRGLESDVRLKDIKASRRHCQIVKTADGFKLVDLGSGNGTFLNGVQVKEHKLSSGDKIQIGLTVITFEGNGAAVPRPAGATPTVASGVMKKTTSHGSIKPNSQASVKATRPVPSTGAKPTGKTSRVGLPPSSVLKKGSTAATQLSRQQTGKMTPQSRRTTQSASARFQAEVGKKKGNPLMVVGILMGVLVLGALVWVFWPGGGGDDRNYVMGQVNKIVQEAAKLEDENKFQEAIQKYGEALSKIENRPKEFQKEIVEIKGRREVAKSSLSDIDQANKAWKGFEEEYQKSPPTKTFRELREMAVRLRNDYSSGKLPWLSKLEEDLSTLDRLIATEDATAEGEKFQGFRNHANEKYDLLKRDKGQFGPAIQEWRREFISKMEEKGDAKAVQLAKAEVEKLEGICREEVLKLKNRLDGMEKSEAVAAVEALLKRVEGSQAASEAEQLLKSLK